MQYIRTGKSIFVKSCSNFCVDGIEILDNQYNRQKLLYPHVSKMALEEIRLNLSHYMCHNLYVQTDFSLKTQFHL
jgi:hypothetical protein